MYAHLSVDPDLVRGYGTASSAQSADLYDVAGRLAAVGTGATAMFGPVGARFLAALGQAAAAEAGTVIALGGALAGTRVAAAGTAAAYESVDADAGAALRRW